MGPSWLWALIIVITFPPYTTALDMHCLQFSPKARIRKSWCVLPCLVSEKGGLSGHVLFTIN